MATSLQPSSDTILPCINDHLPAFLDVFAQEFGVTRTNDASTVCTHPVSIPMDLNQDNTAIVTVTAADTIDGALHGSEAPERAVSMERQPRASRRQANRTVLKQFKRTQVKGGKRKPLRFEDLDRPQYDTPMEFYKIEQDNGLGSKMLTVLSRTLDVKVKCEVLEYLLKHCQGGDPVAPPSAEGKGSLQETVKANCTQLIAFLSKHYTKITAYDRQFKQHSSKSRDAAIELWREWPVELKLFTIITGKLVTKWLKASAGSDPALSGAGCTKQALDAAKVLEGVHRRWGQTKNQQQVRLALFRKSIKVALSSLPDQEKSVRVEWLKTRGLLLPAEATAMSSSE